MVKIMKTDMAHAIYLQHKGKILGDVVRFDSIPHNVHISDIIFTVRILEKLLVYFLFILQL